MQLDAAFVVQPNVTARDSQSNCLAGQLARPLGAPGSRRIHPKTEMFPHLLFGCLSAIINPGCSNKLFRQDVLDFCRILLCLFILKSPVNPV
jgi:hypothetical protein